MSDRERDIIRKIAEGLPYLSEFDKGYFLGIVEAKAEKKDNKGTDSVRKELVGGLTEKEMAYL